MYVKTIKFPLHSYLVLTKYIILCFKIFPQRSTFMIDRINPVVGEKFSVFCKIVGTLFMYFWTYLKTINFPLHSYLVLTKYIILCFPISTQWSICVVDHIK